jgi:hypothetical protein
LAYFRAYLGQDGAYGGHLVCLKLIDDFLGRDQIGMILQRLFDAVLPGKGLLIQETTSERTTIYLLILFSLFSCSCQAMCFFPIGSLRHCRAIVYRATCQPCTVFPARPWVHFYNLISLIRNAPFYRHQRDKKVALINIILAMQPWMVLKSYFIQPTIAEDSIALILNIRGSIFTFFRNFF